jgi:hypothetical protein
MRTGLKNVILVLNCSIIWKNASNNNSMEMAWDRQCYALKILSQVISNNYFRLVLVVLNQNKQLPSRSKPITIWRDLAISLKQEVPWCLSQNHFSEITMKVRRNRYIFISILSQLNWTKSIFISSMIPYWFINISFAYHAARQKRRSFHELALESI